MYSAHPELLPATNGGASNIATAVRADGKPGKAEKNLTLASSPTFHLKRAREKRDEARRLLADGIDPGVQRKQEEHQRRVAASNVRSRGREWLGTKQSWGESHGARMPGGWSSMSSRGSALRL